ncbi:dethiobiotin synthase [Hahella sp. HN01]|uniref:dethiobiotin synthase n=1 Tax=Hahella sp. HN01 TaxID=2847262 RepID=UPI001C1EF1C9|nr:dethiobiotin synthase [Hahella sp. HN01]MBU6950034.1 dethiobiotin synthase [Hahella sp. HN01]
MAKTFFVTGTDTEVGKTFVSAALLHAAGAQGKRTLGLKPVASGCEQTPDGLRNEDALALLRYATVKLPYAQVNPIALEPAIAPHIAAQQAGRTLSAPRLAGLCRGALMTPHDFSLVEGAGGWLTPLNPREYLSDLAAMLDIPVILVVGMRLGCINHALLTVEALRGRRLRLAGWVANQLSAEAMPQLADNLETLSARISAPCLGVVPRAEAPDSSNVQASLRLASLFD